ncbi:MAG: cytochrome c peroxidase [Chitinophagales bacterium]
MKYLLFYFLAILCCISCKHEDKPFYFSSVDEFIKNNNGLSDSALLGKLIFFDKNLSNPVGTSCATCHSPMNGFSDPRHLDFSVGALGQQGTRNAPSISYAVYAPNLRAEILRGVWEEVGGFFLDGRAEFLVRQPFEPMTKATEMNMHHLNAIMEKIKKADYFPLYQKLFGKPAVSDSQIVVFNISLCLEKFEKSYQVNPFTSKYDFYLRGQYTFTPQEKRGLQLFNDSTKAKCALCHLTTPTEYASTDKILFTDYSYDNIGLPKNPNAKTNAIDSGLAKAEKFVKIQEIGKFKTPTLRNVEISAPYMHSGIFTTLEEVMEFYNERDINPKFAHAEVPETVNHDDLGDLKLSKQDISDIIAFLKTLTDGYKPVIKN